MKINYDDNAEMAMPEIAAELQGIAEKDTEHSEILELAARILFACSEMFEISWDDIETAGRVAQDRYNFGIGDE